MVQALREIIELNEFDEASFREASSLFRCADPEEASSQDVMRFLTEDAVDMERRGTTRTYLILNDDRWAEGEVLIEGYFSIALKVLFFSKDIDAGLLEETFGNPKQVNCPAYLIGQLARSETAKKGSGREYLRLALQYIAEASDIVGGRFVYLDCLPEKQGYYEKEGFCFLQHKHKSGLVQMYRVI